MPEEEACTTRSGGRAARGVAFVITSSPGEVRVVRPREERAFCCVFHAPRANDLSLLAVRDALTGSSQSTAPEYDGDGDGGEGGGDGDDDGNRGKR